MAGMRLTGYSWYASYADRSSDFADMRSLACESEYSSGVSRKLRGVSGTGLLGKWLQLHKSRGTLGPA